MIEDRDKWDRWERWRIERLKNTPVDVEHNFKLLDAMYEEARALGKFPLRDPLEGIEIKIRLAKAVNRVQSPTRNPRPGP